MPPPDYPKDIGGEIAKPFFDGVVRLGIRTVFYLIAGIFGGLAVSIASPKAPPPGDTAFNYLGIGLACGATLIFLCRMAFGRR